MDFHDGFMRLWLSIGFPPSGSADANAWKEVNDTRCVLAFYNGTRMPGRQLSGAGRNRQSPALQTAAAVVAPKDAKLTF